jgi:uncharacterized protein (TIGR00730 family)
LKLVNNEIKELRYSFKIFSPYRGIKKVVIFGSARSKKTSAEYLIVEEFSRKLTEKGYMIVTGGGPGVMEAGHKGSLAGNDFALNIRLPFEQKPNPFLNEKDHLINFKYFFTRKLIFIKETDATVLFPGGFGTLDEGFEMLTLIQTGKTKPRPIVLVEPHGSTYWSSWMRFVDEELVRAGFIDASDLKLFRLVTSADAAVEYIDNFYKVYHSLRYVDGVTIIRLNRTISERTLHRLNHEFKDILTTGEVAMAQPTQKEIQENEFLDLPRLALHFNLKEYGRLCELICVINAD